MMKCVIEVKTERDRLRAELAAYKTTQDNIMETKRYAHAEIDRLRAELVRLEWVEEFSKDTVADNDRLRAENASLKAEIDWHVEEIKGGE